MKLLIFFREFVRHSWWKCEGIFRGIIDRVAYLNFIYKATIDLVRLVFSEEVKVAMFSINGGRAPGLDGYIIHFFQVCWSIVGKEVEEAIIQFFTTNELLPAFNSTIVALVPKCKNPNCIRDYRPISCCTMVYKCITKILANKIKKYLLVVIGRSQSAFIQGRSITDNIFMAQELEKGYERSTLSSRCAIKIDLQKAFDSLDWNFLLKVMSVLRFPS